MIYLWQVEIFSCHVRWLERFRGFNHQPVMLPLRLQRKRPWLISSLALQDVSRRLIEIPQTHVGISQYEKETNCGAHFILTYSKFPSKISGWRQDPENQNLSQPRTFVWLLYYYILLTCHAGHIPCCHVERHSLQVCLLGSDTARWQT